MLNRVQAGLGLIALTGLGFVCLGWQSSHKPPPLPQDPHIQVFFNQADTNSYRDPYRRIQRSGDNLEQILLDAINQATTSIDIAVQELNLPLVAQALIDKAQTGVTVRVILEIGRASCRERV